jgi:pimeloyl-ACP methyl ester carboxylesterase/quercetin dioxygenase-like cupin family protein
MTIRLPLVLTVLLGLLLAHQARAHEIKQRDIKFSCEVAEIAATLTLPAHPHEEDGEVRKSACVVIVGGTLSNTRDGRLVRDGVPQRDAIKRLALQLADKGYASIRYDKVGIGESKGTEAWRNTYQQDAEVVAAAVRFGREQGEFERVVVAGESAGAYVACLAAKAGLKADAYLFLGGHCDSGEQIYEYNFARLVDLAGHDDSWRALAEKSLRFELALGRTYKAMFAAATNGDEEFEVVDGDFTRKIPLARRREELQLPPDEMYRYIKQPALALSGEFDLNVPPNHAAKIVQTIRGAGNHNCTCVQIPKADHSFQIGPDDEAVRVKERYSFASFRREYSSRLYEEIVSWLDATLGYSASTKLPGKVAAEPLPVRAVDAPELDAKTANTPARLHLAPGIQIIGDIADKSQTSAVTTLEGDIGPLLLGEGCQAHFINMPAGLYCEEHPHSNESIIYTVRGKWVLCSKGRRHVMQAGTLFHFAPNTPTGYETSLDEDTLILIFKGQRLTKKEEDFMQYLKGLAKRLEQEHKAGVPYLLSDLPKDHAAIRFAQEVKSRQTGN